MQKKSFPRGCKPGPVPCRSKVSIIYLRRRSPAASSSLPSTILPEGKPERAALCPEEPVVYLALQRMRRTAAGVATSTGGHLPHLFTLTPASRGGYFLLRYCELSPTFPLGSMLPYVARTFLIPRKGSDRTPRRKHGKGNNENGTLAKKVRVSLNCFRVQGQILPLRPKGWYREWADWLIESVLWWNFFRNELLES